MEQLRLIAPPSRTEVYMQHLIYQPSNTPEMKPWAVSVEGWSESKLTVQIYHESITGGQARFPNLKLTNARQFASFVAKMLGVYIEAMSKPYVELRPIDLIALERGYEEGVRNAKRFRIVD